MIKRGSVGCIIVAGDEIIARAHNTRQNNHDPLGHAEVKAIQKQPRNEMLDFR